ncbi:MAG: hypothetical protein V9E98_15265 [Candidatus Nanopelagicales bacterium]
MAAFVLVHGGSVTGAVWDPVTQFLAAAGHTVYAPTLTEESTATFSGTSPKSSRSSPDRTSTM